MSKATYKDENGYLRFKDSDILVHRWVVENKLGRPLRPGEVVHHKDRNKLNNDSNNLWVFRSQEEHDMAHGVDAILYGEKASYQGFDKDDEKEEDGVDLIEIVADAANDEDEDYGDGGDYDEGSDFF